MSRPVGSYTKRVTQAIDELVLDIPDGGVVTTYQIKEAIEKCGEKYDRRRYNLPKHMNDRGFYVVGVCGEHDHEWRRTWKKPDDIPMCVANKAREALREILSGVKVGDRLSSTFILHSLKTYGVSSDSKTIHLTRLMPEFGFKCYSKEGPISVWSREFIPSGYMPEADENGHVPTLKERLEAQVASGERKEPKPMIGINENVVINPPSLIDSIEEIGIPVRDIMAKHDDKFGFAVRVPESEFHFERVLVTKKLKGKYGEYKIDSDGVITVDLLVSGSFSLDGLAEIVAEINAVKHEMEAMMNS